MRAARLAMSARGMTLSMVVVSFMVMVPKAAIPFQGKAPPFTDRLKRRRSTHPIVL
jgi:hypothetical protein